MRTWVRFGLPAVISIAIFAAIVAEVVELKVVFSGFAVAGVLGYLWDRKQS